MECPICLEWLPEQPKRCPICGYRFEPQGPVQGERKAAPEPQRLVSQPPGQEVFIPPMAAPFIGRERELKQLREHLTTATDQRPRLIRVRGEAGMGKSRLLEEAFKGLESKPGLVAWSGQPHGHAVVYAPILNWIGSLASIEPNLLPSEVDSRLEALVEGIAGLEKVDALYLQVALGTPAGLAAIHKVPEDHVRHNLHRIIGRLVGAQANTAGICLIVDHAQWIDNATGEWLIAALDGIASNRLTIVALTRDPNLGWQPVAAPDLEIQLEPFSASERTKLFDAIVPALEFLPELRRRVIDNDVGTPLFINELARLIQQVMAENAGPIRPDQAAFIIEVLPLSLEDLIRRRIERMDERTRWLLAVAALLGTDCCLGLLECFDQIKGNLEDQLRALEGLRIIERHGGENEPRYRFIEGSVRDLSFETMLPDQRQALHGQVASALEKAYAGRLDEQFELLAYHHDQAGHADQTTYWRIKAADRRSRLGQISPATVLYQQILDQIEKLEATPLHQTRLVRVLIRQGRLMRFQGQADEAFEMLESARALGERLKNEYLMLQAQVEWAVTALWQGRNEEAAALLAFLRVEARSLELPCCECVILNSLGVIDWHEGRFESALGRFRELAELARTAGMDHLEADALNNTGLIYWRWSRYAEAARVFRAAAAIRMRIGDRFGLIAALMNLAIIQEQMGEIAPARGNYRQALELAGQTGFLQGQATIEVNLSNLERRAGLVSAALDHAAQALDMARRVGDPLSELTAMENLGLAHGAMGRPDEAVRCLKEALELARKAGAEEKQVQIELDLLEIDDRNGRTGSQRLVQIDELLCRIESAGWRDLLPQACRLKGRWLKQNETIDQAQEYLNRSLDFAIQSHNIFEEWESLNELLRWSQPKGSKEAQVWENRATRIERMVRIRGEADSTTTTVEE